MTDIFINELVDPRRCGKGLHAFNQVMGCEKCGLQLSTYNLNYSRWMAQRRQGYPLSTGCLKYVADSDYRFALGIRW